MRMLSQQFNWPAVALTARVLVREPGLLVPHLEVANFSHLDFEAMHAAGCTGLVLDKDNTVTSPYAMEVHPQLESSLEHAKAIFGPDRIVLLSNSAGTPDDPSNEAADAIEHALGFTVLRRRHKKPRGFESVEAYFGPDTDVSSLAMVGDRYLTDVTFGNLHGMFTVRTAPITDEGESFVIRRARGFEEGLVQRYRRQGIKPPRHKPALALEGAA